jgi:phosphatidylglycerophosphate synthase
LATPRLIASSRFYKGILNKALSWVPLPKISPNLVSVLSVVSVVIGLIFLNKSAALFFACVVLSMIFDGLDGMIARKHNLTSEGGYIVDVLFDRLSEGIIFVGFMPWWFALFGLNVFLTIFSYKKGVHMILPLKFLFIIYYAIFFLH